MSAQTSRRGATSARGDIFLLILVTVVLGSVVSIGLLLAVGQTMAGQEPTWNPLQGLLEVMLDQRPWPVQATILVVLFVVLVVVLVVGIALGRSKRKGKRRGVDAAAATMQRPGAISGLGRADALKDAKRLRPSATFDKGDNPGILLGRTVRGDRPLFMNWESGALIMAGPRMGKSTSLAIPAIMEAPGAVVATSNKGDVHDATRLAREAAGGVWVFDPQGVTGNDTQTFWWNPLERISRVREARKLASFFVAGANTSPDARVDSYFDGGAKELLSCMLLAAACADGDLLHAYEWLGNFQSTVPSTILADAGQESAARRLEEARSLNPRQRDGLVDMARRFLGVLADPEYAALVTPPARRTVSTAGGSIDYGWRTSTHRLPQFKPEEFVASTDTLYALSIEGEDSAASLVTALVGQVFEEAVKLGAASAGRRLDPPLVAVLDEAANVCKLSELPKQYSHFGSRGVILLTFLQSPAQGQGVWGRDGMDSMSSAANVKFYGGNVADTTYLESLTKLIGEHDVLTETSSYGGNSASRSQSWKRESILTVSELAALPEDRAIIQSAKNAPVLCRKIPWWERPYAEQVTASIARFSGDSAPPPDETVAQVVRLNAPRSPAFGPGSGYVDPDEGLI